LPGHKSNAAEVAWIVAILVLANREKKHMINMYATMWALERHSRVAVAARSRHYAMWVGEAAHFFNPTPLIS